MNAVMGVTTVMHMMSVSTKTEPTREYATLVILEIDRHVLVRK